MVVQDATMQTAPGHQSLYSIHCCPLVFSYHWHHCPPVVYTRHMNVCTFTTHVWMCVLVCEGLCIVIHEVLCIYVYVKCETFCMIQWPGARDKFTYGTIKYTLPHPTPTSPHLTSPHLTLPYLTCQMFQFYLYVDLLSFGFQFQGFLRWSEHFFKNYFLDRILIQFITKLINT